MLQYSQIKLTCIILLCNNIQYQFCCACECSLTSRGHCSFFLFWLFFLSFSFLGLFFSATETSYVTEKKKITVSMWLWTRGQPLHFISLIIAVGVPPHLFFLLFFNRDFVGGLLDVVWNKISVCGDWPGFYFIIIIIICCKDPTKTTPLHYFWFWSDVSLITSLPPL